MTEPKANVVILEGMLNHVVESRAALRWVVLEKNKESGHVYLSIYCKAPPVKSDLKKRYELTDSNFIGTERGTIKTHAKRSMQYWAIILQQESIIFNDKEAMDKATSEFGKWNDVVKKLWNHQNWEVSPLQGSAIHSYPKLVLHLSTASLCLSLLSPPRHLLRWPLSSISDCDCHDCVFSFTVTGNDLPGYYEVKVTRSRHASQIKTVCNELRQVNNTEAGDEQRDARLSFQPEGKLDDIFVKDLTVEYMDGGNSVEGAFHKEKARHHFDCFLGGGSFGEVFKAKHTRHGEVAVKVVKLGKEDRVMMYQKEARKHGRALTCPHIVAIKGFVQCDDYTCHCGLIGIVMEFMQCGSLWDFRTNEWEDRPDIWPLINRMVYQISSGMHFLHSKEIIHCDLKLEKVLLDASLNAKVSIEDLGLATNLRTSSGAKCWGTDSHKPPEAFRTDLPSSTKIVSTKYDVYSFAMTLYELLTGIHPYDERGFDIMRLLKVDVKQPPDLEPVPPSTPEDLKQIMIDSWSYEPDHRPEFKDIKERVKKLDIEPTFELLGHFVKKIKDMSTVMARQMSAEMSEPHSEATTSMKNTLSGSLQSATRIEETVPHDAGISAAHHEFITDTPPDLILQEDEAIIACGIRFSPSGAKLTTPVKVTLDHNAHFTNPQKADIVFYTRSKGMTTFERIPSSSEGYPRCEVRTKDLDLFVDHFCQWWIVAKVRRYFIGKRVNCTPYVKPPVCKGRIHTVILYIYEDLIEIEKKVTAHMAEYTVLHPPKSLFVAWSSGDVVIKLYEGLNEPRVQLKEMRMTEQKFYQVSCDPQSFYVPSHVGEANQKPLQFILCQSSSRSASDEINILLEYDAGDEQHDARLSFQPEVKLDHIFVKDLTVEYMDGGNSIERAFHNKKAREHIDCHLGGGAFGEVFKAKHPRHGEVAVKVAKHGKEDQVMMYQKEAGKHGQVLTCPHIVAIKGFLRCDDDTCHCGLIGIVMEFMQHGSLWDFRTYEWEDRPDLWPLINRMVYQISSGMSFLHDEIIHRDLKLENVLLDHHLTAKIADLGLATNLCTSSGDKSWGTDSHKPPEAFRTDLPSSTKIVTIKYDVYSFAMTLYELLTGIHPYAERGFDMIRLLKVDPEKHPCLLPIPQSTPEDLKQIMIDSWSYEPDHRPEFKDIKERVKKLGIEPTFELLKHFVEKSKTLKKGGNSPPLV